ncbi:MAG: hypothetical protein WCO09_02895, partial [bacterium]
MGRRNKKTNITVGILLLIIIAVAIYVFVINKGNHKENKFINVDTSATSTKNVNFDPLNFTYDIEGEKIILKDGTSTSDVVPGSAEKLETTVFDKPAIGDLNGDGKNDSAILLVQDSGGTGLFYYLVGVYSDAGVAKNTNSIFIGDRIEPVSVVIKNSKIELSYVDRNPNDPMTADPTVK